MTNHSSARSLVGRVALPILGLILAWAIFAALLPAVMAARSVGAAAGAADSGDPGDAAAVGLPDASQIQQDVMTAAALALWLVLLGAATLGLGAAVVVACLRRLPMRKGEAGPSRGAPFRQTAGAAARRPRRRRANSWLLNRS